MANPEKIVTEELVFSVANRLKEAGIEPSNRKVLAETGGSMATVAPLFRKWRETQRIEAPARAEAVEVPQPVLDALRHAGELIWQAAVAEIRKEVDAVTEQANQRVRAAETDRDQLVGELGESEAELATVKEAKTRQEEEHSDARKAAENEKAGLVDALSRAQQDLSAATARATELDNQVSDVRAERDRLHHELDQERERGARLQALLEEKQRSSDKDLDRARSELQEVRKQTEAEIQRSYDRVLRTEQETEAARKEAKAAAIEAAQLQGQLKALQDQVAALMKEVRGKPSTKGGK